jgi:hypothetical protein
MQIRLIFKDSVLHFQIRDFQWQIVEEEASSNKFYQIFLTDYNFIF